MLFNEIYGNYYKIVSDVLKHAVDGALDNDVLMKTVIDKGFAESVMTIPDAIKSGVWPLIRSDWTTPIRNIPSMPLTILQKRWLKALLSDPRIALFEPDMSGLEDVEPLYPPDVFVYFDRYQDGDPYDDPDYIENFRTILKALRERKKLIICFTSGKGRKHVWRDVPYKLEYSSKDDKFRLQLLTKEDITSINVARIEKCSIMWEYAEDEYPARSIPKDELVFELTDERNALERAMLAFANHEKVTERLDDIHYKVTLRYEREDETEILIRILSFGPMIKVISPDSFVEKIKERLNMQKRFAGLR